MKVPKKFDVNLTTTWDKVKAGFKKALTWFVRYPLALLVAVLIIAGVSLLLASGYGDNFNIGGILGKLFGSRDRTRKDSPRVIVANSVPDDREDGSGDPIPIETPDERGIVQREVKVLDQPKNPFRDKSVLKIQDSLGEERTILLPEGVQDKDVDRVLEIRPAVYKVEVKARPEGRVTEDDLSYLE